MAIKYLKSSKIENKTVLLRVDVNVPIDNGQVSDSYRIEQIIPTVRYLQDHGNKVLLCGHLGRPKGEWNKKYSLEPVARFMADLMSLKYIATDYDIPDYEIPHLIFYSGDITEPKYREQLKNIHPKDIALLENLRFYKGEEENDTQFAKVLAALGEIYINDAFGVDHRKAASVVDITKYLPSYAGLLLEKEIKSLETVLKQAPKPFVVMTGGIKLTEKVGTLENLGKKADVILVGGGVANLMFKNKGYEIGQSKIEEGEDKIAWQIMKNFKNKIVFPIDVVVANKNMDKDSVRVCLAHEVAKEEQILDAGPKTIMEFSKHIKAAKTIVWSGPLGLFEKSPFHHATFALARLIGGRGKGKAFVVAGGGDTVDAIRQSHQFEHLDHVSTGGGAMLEFLAGKKLPGIEALK